MSNDCESEIEELMNPKDELKKKIVAVAVTVRKWNAETAKVRKTVKTQLDEILDLGLNKYRMQTTDLRDLAYKIFKYYGISDSWFRKLLPEELKNTTKTRLSYLQKHEIEKERQRLLQQQASVSRQESENREYSHSNGYGVGSASYQSEEPEITPSSILSNESTEVQNEPSEAYRKIEKLETEVRRLSMQFVAKANLQGLTKTLPLIAHIDPVKRKITWIRFENGSGI